MKRKINLVGQNTLTVSLPSKWAKEHNLKKGDEVELREEDTALKIDVKSKPEIKRLSINLKKGELLFKRYIVMAYQIGYDELEITSESSLCVDDIKRTLDRVLGFEIVEQREKRCLIKMITEPMEDQFEIVLKRIFLLNKGMGEETHMALASKKIEGLKEIAMIEATVNKFACFCFRSINKSSNVPKDKNTFYCLTIDCLEKVADYYRDICLTVNKENINKIDKGLIEFLKGMNEFFALYYQLFYSFNKECISELTEKRDLLKAKEKELVKQLKGEQMMVMSQLTLLLDIINHSMLLLSPITLG